MSHAIVSANNWIRNRLRGFLPVVVDFETSGVNPNKNAILSLGAVFFAENNRSYQPSYCYYEEVIAFHGAHIQSHAYKVHGIDVFNSKPHLRGEVAMLEDFFALVRLYLKELGCTQAILVGHNANFDLSFLNQSCLRNKIRNNPFHRFSVIDTVALAGAMCGETVLTRAFEKLQIPFQADLIHHAGYDADRTAEMFCRIFNHSENQYLNIASPSKPKEVSQ